MEELKNLFMYVGAGFIVEVLIGVICYCLAKKKGRDSVGWCLAGFFFSILSLLIIALLPAIETYGFTKRCQGCGRIILWNDTTCRKCGRELDVHKRDLSIKVRRPLRSCFLYVFLLIFVILIVFGFIGYFCVPNQPQLHSSIMMVIG